MCEVTLATALTIASTAVGAYSAYSQGQQQAAMAKQQAANNMAVADYNAQVEENNAVYAQQAAKNARERGANDYEARKSEYRAANAEARARFGSSGLLVDTGTALDLMEDNIRTGELNSLIALDNAEKEAFQYDVSSQNSIAQARNLRWQGQMGVQYGNQQASAYRQAGALNAGTALVTGANNYNQRYGNSNAGNVYAPSVTNTSNTPWVRDVRMGRANANQWSYNA